MQNGVGGIARGGGGGGLSLWAAIVIAVLSAASYLLYHQVSNLHDIAHYMVAGISMVKDHHPLVYPYTPMDPSPGWSAYSYFQDNSRLAPLYKAYPSQLYSALFGIYHALTGSVSFAFGQFLSMLAFVVANLLLYHTGARLFGRGIGILFLIAVAFTPVLYAVLYPGNDSFGYLGSAVILWACFAVPLRPLLIGVAVGVGGYLRAQALELVVVAPLLFFVRRETLDIWKVLARYVLGVVASYLLLSAFFQMWQGGARAVEGGGLDFYIDYFRNAITGSALSASASRLLHNTRALADSGFLYYLSFTAVGSLLLPAPKESKALSFGGLLVVAVPLVLYSLDPFSNPHARYYLMAVPLFVLAWFYWMMEHDKGTGRGLAALSFTTVLAVAAWLHLYGIPSAAVASWSIMRDRFTYPDADLLGKGVASQFSKDDLLITNHALGSVLTPARNLIPYPSFREFAAGDNRQIDGILFVYGTAPPDDFFAPRDWMRNGTLPDVITDNQGVRFERVANASVKMPNMVPGSTNQVQLVAYKNATPVPHDMGQGGRTFRVSHLVPGLEVRTKDPSFEQRNDWRGAAQPAPGGGVIVGPGSRSANILSQPVAVVPGEPLILSVSASAYDMTNAWGRLQINWFDAQNKLIGADIARFKAGTSQEQFRRKVFVPAGARQGVLVITPDRGRDVLRFTRAEVLGRTEKASE